MELLVLLLNSGLTAWRRQALAALVVIAATFAGCDKNACENPFLGGFSPSGEVPLEPVTAGKSIGLHVNLATTSAASLEESEVEIALPPEVEVKEIVNPQSKESGVETLPGRLVWRPGKLSARSEKRLFISVVSKSDWKLWKTPVQVDMTVKFHNTWGGECRNWPDGRYRMTSSWSSKGSQTREWHQVSD